MAREDQGSAESVARNFDNTGLVVDELEGTAAYTYAEQLKEKIASYGLSQRDRPRVTSFQEGLTELKAGQYFDGRLPPVLIRLSLDQLSSLYTLFSNWYAYVMSLLKTVAIDRSEAKRQREFLWAMIRQQYKFDAERLDNDGNPKKRNTQEMGDMAKLDIRFINADSLYEQQNMLYQYLEAMAMVAEQDMKMISREITIQQIKIEAEYNRRGLLSGGVRLSSTNTPSFKDRQERDEDEPSGQENPPMRQAVRPPVSAAAKGQPRVPAKARIGVRLPARR